jgi:hypothetical protein
VRFRRWSCDKELANVASSTPRVVISLESPLPQVAISQKKPRIATCNLLRYVSSPYIHVIVSTVCIAHHSAPPPLTHCTTPHLSHLTHSHPPSYSLSPTTSLRPLPYSRKVHPMATHPPGFISRQNFFFPPSPSTSTFPI